MTAAPNLGRFKLGTAQDKLIQAELAAEVAISAARGAVTVAQSRVDEFRTGLVREHAEAWRAHAELLRQRAVDAGDETTVTSVAVQGGLDGARMEPRLAFVRNVLGDQADRADATASHLQGYLLRGNGLTSEALATLVGQLGPLPEAAETVAA
jgi:hypothetical protein